ncbi:cupredoxin domain-containing protein [Terricaulis silvestris]|uniref:Amicyanin-alpha n=1 Tax=Terricaulis silvestris TaxID=2686094 RepID=A0A6I6ML79_9CAUL|nr:plastocyanin/azurin family copper-binding protein [Terricaulis silvestris]QGZ93417.1 Amicyanin-alpha precursor [Terricaulis silvestris]
MKLQVKITLAAIALTVLATGSALAIVRHRVDQSGLRFSVAALRLQRGDSIAFTNSDRSSHNILVRGGAMNFNGGLQRPGQALEVPFTASGRYQVICGIHPRMRLDVEVQ